MVHYSYIDTRGRFTSPWTSTLGISLRAERTAARFHLVGDWLLMALAIKGPHSPVSLHASCASERGVLDRGVDFLAVFDFQVGSMHAKIRLSSCDNGIYASGGDTRRLWSTFGCGCAALVQSSQNGSSS